MTPAESPHSKDAALLTEGGVLRVLPAPDAHDAEAALIFRAQSGERAAMHLLLSPWNDRIYSFLITLLRNSADAEDAAQETFLRIVKGLPNYHHTGQFQAWVYRIARNQAALTATRRRRMQAHEASVDTEVLNDFPADAPTEDGHAERAERLRAAVDELPAAEREVVLLRLNEDLKFREIAERTQAPLNTVLGRMRNALRRLHDHLQLFLV